MPEQTQISFFRIFDPPETAVFDQVAKFDRTSSQWKHGFVRYDLSEADQWGAPPIKFIDKIQLPSKEVLVPGNIEWIEKGFLILPSGVKEYYGDENLFNNLVEFLKRYILLDEKFYKLIASYIFLTWSYNRFPEIPYLRFLGDYATGKSRALEVVSSLAFRAVRFGGAIRPASIYRVIDQVGGTLILDETDFGENSDINQILCTGYRRNNPIVRCNPKTFQPEVFNTFCPKAIASRKSFTDEALESRCITIFMNRRDLPPEMPRVLKQDFEEEAENLRNQLLLWRLRHIDEEKVSNHPIEGLSNRYNEIAIPLITLFPHLEEELRKFFLDLQSKQKLDASLSEKAVILQAILQTGSLNDCDRTMSVISKEANSISNNFNHNYKFTARKIGQIIRELDLVVKRGKNGYYIPKDENRKQIVILWEEVSK